MNKFVYAALVVLLGAGLAMAQTAAARAATTSRAQRLTTQSTQTPASANRERWIRRESERDERQYHFYREFHDEHDHLGEETPSSPP